MSDIFPEREFEKFKNDGKFAVIVGHIRDENLLSGATPVARSLLWQTKLSAAEIRTRLQSLDESFGKLGGYFGEKWDGRQLSEMLDHMVDELTQLAAKAQSTADDYRNVRVRQMRED